MRNHPKEKTSLKDNFKIFFRWLKKSISTICCTIKNFSPSALLKPYLGFLFLGVCVLLAYIILDQLGILIKLSNIEDISAIISSKYKAVSVIIYIIIQMFQVILIPIPAFLTTSAGILVFGNWFEPLLYSLIAIIPASIIAFCLGRWLGKPFVAWMIGKDNMKKYLLKTAGKEKPVFFTMFLLPVFPDDILCFVAGVTPMSLKFFTLMQFITRPPAIIGTILMVQGVFKTSFFSSPIGIILMIIGVLAYIIIVVASIKYAEQMQNFFEKLFSHKKENSLSQGDDVPSDKE